ncbi:MAG: hypothetical protein IJ637_07245 [Prevotella sp.]|nr:hypothetical protein [Prevotella sp.]
MRKQTFGLMAFLLMGFVLTMAVALSGCHRPRVRHDHSKQMMQVRVARDSAQKNDIASGSDDDWQDDDLIEIPSESSVGSSDGDGDKIERLMRGEDVDF